MFTARYTTMNTKVDGKEDTMKRRICILIILMIALAGCNSANMEHKDTSAPEAMQSSPTAAASTPLPTPTATPEPEGEMGYARANGVGLIYILLNRGDAIEVIGEDSEYYVASLDGIELMLEKRLVAMHASGEYESWTGYARSKAPVYSNFHLIGDIIQELKTNTSFTVLADLGNCYIVLFEDESMGYIPAKSVSKSKISGGGGGGGNGGGGGGSDGGDIVLGLFGDRFSVVRLNNSGENQVEFIPGGAKVLANETEAYLRFLSKDEAVKVIDATESHYTVLEGGRELLVAKPLLRLESEPNYVSWNGYARNQAPFYYNLWLTGDADKLKQNAELLVLDDLGHCYFVQINGSFGFIPTDQVSAEKLKSESGGGGGSGGGGEWTEPVL